MVHNFRAFFLSLTIVSIMMFSVYGTTIVYADDGTTTESTEESTPAPSTDESVTPDSAHGTAQPEDQVPTTEETPQPEEAVATETTTAPTEEDVATEATPQVEESVAEISPEPSLEQLPDNTTVTVINSEGEVQPLASQESADAVTTATDPMWCPIGQTPGGAGCTASFSSFTELLTFLQANEGDAAYQQPGTIYIEQGAYAGGEDSIDFNNYAFTNFNNYDLTLQGGWDPSDNSTDATSQFNAPIIIGSSLNPWVGSLAFNGLVISSVTNQTGLTAYTEGNITVSNVEVTDSQAGAELSASGNVLVEDSKFNDNNKAGAVVNAGGTVDINDSEFNGNGGTFNPGFGLKIDSGSNVSLKQVLANNNEKFGADITADGKVSVSNSVFSGNVEYRYYCWSCTYKFAIGGYGLKIVSLSDIAIDGITADDNYFFGATLDGANVKVSNGTFNNNGTGRLEEWVGYGLKVKSNSDLGVTLDNVSANNNENFGANIEATGKVVVMNSFFNGNKSYTYDCSGKTYHGYGLQVVTTGNIALNTVTASENNLFGALLKGAVVSITNGTFNNNGSGSSKFLTGSGLEIVSTSSVALSNVAANANQLFGANIQAVGDVSIASGFFNCNKVTTYHPCLGVGTGAVAGGYGLKIVTGGSIALADVEAIDNYLYGASLTGFNVTIANGVFSYNGSGSEDKAIGYGLKVVSDGKVTIDNIAANYNQLYGADIVAKDSVSISTGFFNGQQSYTFNPCTGAANYYGYGLQVFTEDDITLDGVQANFNNLWGANLDAQDVLILDSQFNNNVTKSVVFIDDTGLLVNSLGNVTLINVEAKENRLIGASITAVGNVNISGSNFSDNKGTTCSNAACYHVTYNGYGLKVVTPGSIFLGNVIADNNNLFGANLTGSSVTIFDSTFNNNGSGDSKDPTGKGLEVVSTGDVTLMNVNASYNELFGANIQSEGTVTISSSIFNGNQSYTYSCKGTTGQGYGLKVVTPGNINLVPGGNGIGVTANDNGAEGAILEGENVVVVNSSFTGNGATGLTITATIATLSGVTASDNGVDGAKICADVVTVTGSTFANNNRYGLNVGTPQLVEVGNTYTGNGTAGLFANPTCVTAAVSTSSNNNNNTSASNSNHWSNGHGTSYHGHQFGNSYHGGSSHKSCHSIGNKHSKR